MICAPIDTEAPRFRVVTIEGYPITSIAPVGAKQVFVATVLDGFYYTEHGRFASNDKSNGPGGYRGREGALAAAAARCAELNAWHEREGWGE